MKCLKRTQVKIIVPFLVFLGLTLFILQKNEIRIVVIKGSSEDRNKPQDSTQHLQQNESKSVPNRPEDIAIGGRRMKQVHVLLNSYMRSGSSYLGRILGHRKDVFYYYEPLWTDNIWVYHKGMDNMCGNIKPSCITKPHELDISRSILKNVYACQLRKIGRKFRANPHGLTGYAGPKWTTFNVCINRKRDQNSCLAEMEQVCLNQSARVTKVLRLDLSLAELILRDNPGLKIVHLFRDPRGSINSHVFTKWFPVSLQDMNAIQTDARTLCDRMKVDIYAAVRYQERFPTRLRGLHYEDFYDVELKVKKLYDFLGLNSSHEYLNFVQNLPNEKSRTVYDKKDNRVDKLFSYRETLPWNIVQVVEKQCAEVIGLLGLKLYENEQNYHDKEFSPIDGKLKFELR